MIQEEAFGNHWQDRLEHEKPGDRLGGLGNTHKLAKGAHGPGRAHENGRVQRPRQGPAGLAGGKDPRNHVLEDGDSGSQGLSMGAMP